MPHQCLACGRTFDEGSPDLLKGCPGCGGTRFFFTQEPLDEEARQELQAKSEADIRQVIQEALANDGAGLGSWRDRQAWLRIDPTNMKRTLREVVEEAAVQEDQVPDRIGDIEIAREETPDPAEVARAMDAASRDVREAKRAAEAHPEDVEPPAAVADLLGGGEAVDAAEPAADTSKPRAKRGSLRDLRPPPAEPGEVPTPARKRAPKVRAAPPRDVEIVLRPIEETSGEAPERPVSTVTIEEPGRYNIDVESLLSASPIIVEKDGVFMVHLPSIFDAVEKAKGQSGGD